ncbi:MAG: SDR family oxidoreductase [Gallionellaceae bacterium]|nr:SDR family oxidoreductase [Gallionellaceae bacterium]
MLFLITGASGFVGKSLCAELLRQGKSVRAAVRSTHSSMKNTEVVPVGSINGETSWTDVLHGVDIVVHLAARVHVMQDTVADPLLEFCKVNLHGTSNLARQAAHAGVKRFIYVSSIKVNGEETQNTKKYSETDIPAPQDAYAVSKWEAEQALHRIARETSLEIVILRPPLVYGPGVKGNFAHMLATVARSIPLPLASVHNQRSLLYVANLVSALITAATNPSAAGQTYLVSDGEDISTPELLRCLASAMAVPSHLIPFPLVLLRGAGRVLGKHIQLERLMGSLQIDSDKIRRDLNWIPPYSLQQGLQATAEWYQNKT